jgi:hypothetical protein
VTTHRHSPDVEIEPGVSVGEWLYRELMVEVVFEGEAWSVDRITRIVGRLDAQRPGKRPLQVVVPWLFRDFAFTAPGPYIFFCRGLYQLCGEDETTAFVIAHEMAHHDLGHLDLVPHWMGRLARRWGGETAALVVGAVERRLYGPERECDADAYALRLCMKAGYDPERCLDLFRILEQRFLDLGDVKGVYGPDVESDKELEPDAPFLTKARMWAFQRTRGYLPLQDRLYTLRHAVLGTR